MQLDALTQTERDRLFCSLLEALYDALQELPKDAEHTWEKLQSLQEGMAVFSVETIREAAHVMFQVGFLKSMEDRGDTFVCGGLTQLGAVRIRYYKAAARSYIVGAILFVIFLLLLGTLQWYIKSLDLFYSMTTMPIGNFLDLMFAVLLVAALSVYQYYYP